MKTLVVTPTLGNSPWLADCVHSVAEAASSSVHVLVTVAGRVADLQARWPAAYVIAESPGGGGMYAAINAGIAAAPGGWDAFTYLNDDDLLLPGFAEVERAIGAASVAAPLIAYGRVQLIDPDGRRLGAIPISPAPALNRALYAQRLEPVFQHGTLVNRAALTRLGGFDATLRFCGDTEFLARACVLGFQFERVSGPPVAAFRLHRGQLTKNRAAMLAERARVDDQLGLLTQGASWPKRWAKLRYRLANSAVYAERIARHGWISFDQLLERGG